MPGDEIHGDLVFEDGDIGLLQDPGHQNAFHLLTGHIVGMNDAPAGMAALPGEIEVRGGVAGQIKMGPQIDQFLDAFRSRAHHQLHGILVTEAVARGQGVFDVQIEAVIRAEHGGDAALGLAGAGFHDAAFGDHVDGAMAGHLQGVAQAGQTGADDQKI